MENEVLTKADVRGRRNLKTKTFKRSSSKFDDEKDVKGGKRRHSTIHGAKVKNKEMLPGLYGITYHSDDYEDEPYGDWVDTKSFR